MDKRARAQQLAAEYLAQNDPTGWFEPLYREAERDAKIIPWADFHPNPNLLEFWSNHPIASSGKTALTIGCGLGDDAEQLAVWGFQTTAFDISASAITVCRQRFPTSKVRYTVADLLNPPHSWISGFDFVLEAYTLQVLPRLLRDQAITRVTKFVREGGYLLLIARGREEQEPEGQMPWPLTRGELDKISDLGLRELSIEDYWDRESPPVRRFQALYQK